MATTTKSTTSKPRKTVLTPGKLQAAHAAKSAPVTLKSVAKPALAAAPTPDAKQTEEIGKPALRKAELVQRVVLASGLKKRDVKPTVEAMLTVLGKALENGEELNLQPFGRFMIKKRKDLEKAEILTCRVRRKKV